MAIFDTSVPPSLRLGTDKESNMKAIVLLGPKIILLHSWEMLQASDKLQQEETSPNRLQVIFLGLAKI